MAAITRSEAEDLLYREARLLDDQRHTEWLAMLAPSVIYFIPCNDEALQPDKKIAIVYDDWARLTDRIARLTSGLAHAQSPPSKTRRLVSNVQVEEAGTDTATVTSAFILYELRRNRDRVFAGRYTHRLLRDGEEWKIAAKTALLVNNDEVIDNLTFIV